MRFLNDVGMMLAGFGLGIGETGLKEHQWPCIVVGAVLVVVATIVQKRRGQ